MTSAMILKLFLLVVLVHMTYGKCPRKCYCTATGVYCQGVRRFPDLSLLPSWTVNVSIYRMDIPYIPAAAFRDLPNVKTISIYEGSIGDIHPCAFQGLQNLDRLELYNVDIGTVEMYAFSDMRNIRTFSIYKSKIDYIQSYSFYNIKSVKTFTLHTLNIGKINSHAFYAVGAIADFYVYANNVTKIRRGAFSHSSFSTVNMFYNFITDLECHTIDVLRGSSRNFHFYSNELQCGCHMAWLMAPRKKSLLADSRGPVKCAGPSQNLRGVKAMQLKTYQLDCKKRQYLTSRIICPPVTVPPPAKTRARQCLKRY